MPAADSAQILTIRSRADLRAWLAENHSGAPTVWLASFKRHHPEYLAYEPIVEELLCWGWIDSVTRALDADRSMMPIAPLSPKPARSAINKAHVDRARASGAMTPAGEAKVALALASGQWDFRNDVDALIAPDDLLAALDAKGLRGFWELTPRSVRRGTLEWIKTAKMASTRVKRIADVTTSAASGLRPGPFRSEQPLGQGAKILEQEFCSPEGMLPLPPPHDPCFRLKWIRRG